MAKARKPDDPRIVDLDMATVDGLLARAAERMPADDHALIRTLVENHIYLVRLVHERGTTIARLRHLFGLRPSEKTKDVLGGNGGTKAPGPDAGAAASTGGASGSAPGAPSAAGSPSGGDPGTANADGAPEAQGADTSDKPKGHGRVPASDYPDARHIPVGHDHLHAGQGCPACTRGTLYKLAEPVRLLRIVGRAPLGADCWDCEQLRCSACGQVFTAKAPPEAEGPKYTESAAAMMVLLRYGTGVPLNRLDQLQRDLRVPVPASTQWDVARERSELVRPVFDELRRQAAQGQIVHNDDTTARILEFMGRRRAELLEKGELEDPERTGLFTTSIISKTAEGRRIALFLTGRKHAGENLADVLGERDTDLPAPILMCDALDRNVPEGHAVVEANCMAHGRRHVVDEVANFPDECAHLLTELGKVFKVEKRCRAGRFSPEERLAVHQRDSGPVMDDLQKWMTALLEQKRIEPNSGLGQALTYLLKRWSKLTLFLRVPGAPIENNICERALKYAIRHRKNSLFYKTQRGARVGDIWMTLIHTATLNGENPFHYLTVLQRHAKAVAASPGDWLPWNYRLTVAALEAGPWSSGLSPPAPAAATAHA